jgi:hypothetical protein
MSGLLIDQSEPEFFQLQSHNSQPKNHIKSLGFADQSLELLLMI